MLKRNYIHLSRNGNIEKNIGGLLTANSRTPNYTLKPLLKLISDNKLGDELYLRLENFNLKKDFPLEETIKWWEETIKVYDDITLKELLLKHIGELVFEYIRQFEFEEKQYPSRYDCIYLLDNIEEITQWPELDSNEKVIYKLQVKDEQKLYKADSKWIKFRLNGANSDASYKNMAIEDIKNNARKYWNGVLTENCRMEYLFCGSLKIIDKIEAAK